MTVDTEYYYLNNPNCYVNLVMKKIGMNFQGFFRYMKDIVNTKISQFHYENLDIPHLTSVILEEALMFKSRLCFAQPPGYTWMLCTYNPLNEYNLYHRPTHVELLTFNGDSLGTVPYEDIILVRDNAMDIPPILVIKEYVDKIVDLENKMDKIVTLSTLPIALVGDKKIANQLREAARKMGSPDPFIVGDDKIISAVQGFNIDLPVKPAEVYAIRKKYINECMASIGVYAVEAKKERLVVSEIQSQNDYTDFIYQGLINERNRWVDELNKRRGSKTKLVESYDQNQEALREEAADRAHDILKAQAEAIKEVDPEADFSQANPAKVKTTGGEK